MGQCRSGSGGRSRRKRRGIVANRFDKANMIADETVLILGAGASFDYGYPVGRALMESIWDALRTESTLTRLLYNCNFSEKLIRQFGADLRECNLPSIDAFLEHRGVEFERIGKAAIAGTLIPCEILANLSRIGWYEYLHSRVIGRIGDFQRNKLTVVTFNYDRSFEAALFIALQKTYNLTDTAAADYVKVIPVIHVYGQLGGLPHLSDNGRPYDLRVDAKVIEHSIQGIKIVHEGKEDTPEFQLAQEKISKAKVVCCLGFGYHPENVKRLNLSQTLDGVGKRVYLSTYGFTNMQANKILHRIFPNGKTSDVRMEESHLRIQEYLKATAVLE